MGKLILGARHVKAAKPLLVLIAVSTAVLGLILLGGGIYLAAADKYASTNFTLFGNAFASSSVGVAMVFIGVVMTILGFRGLLRTVVQLARLPD